MTLPVTGGALCGAGQLAGLNDVLRGRDLYAPRCQYAGLLLGEGSPQAPPPVPQNLDQAEALAGAVFADAGLTCNIGTG